MPWARSPASSLNRKDVLGERATSRFLRCGPFEWEDAPLKAYDEVRTPSVVGRGIDPRTSRFSGARSTN